MKTSATTPTATALTKMTRHFRSPANSSPSASAVPVIRHCAAVVGFWSDAPAERATPSKSAVTAAGAVERRRAPVLCSTRTISDATTPAAIIDQATA